MCSARGLVLMLGAALVGMLALPGVTLSQCANNVLVNGDFSQGCNYWTFADSSVSYQGSQPWATVNCDSAQACVTLYDMYGRGFQWQSFSPSIQPKTFAFDYDEMTKDEWVEGRLYRNFGLTTQTEVVSVACETGVGHFNRIMVTILGTTLIWVNGGMPSAAHVEVDLASTTVTAYVNGVEVGSSALPSGDDLTSSTAAVFTGCSNHWEATYCYDNIACKICGPVPVKETTWGRVKSMYR